MKTKLMTGVLALAAAGAMWAHGNADHVMGTARAVTANSVTVETADHKMVTVAMRPDTEIRKSNMKAKILDLHPGDRVVIHAEKNKMGKYEAEEVEWGASK